MSYGLHCLCEGGLVIDTSSITGVLQDALTLNTSQTGTLSYPSLVGRTIYVLANRSFVGTGIAFSNKFLVFNISYASGFPVVSYSPTGSDADLNLNVYVVVQ